MSKNSNKVYKELMQKFGDGLGLNKDYPPTEQEKLEAVSGFVEYIHTRADKVILDILEKQWKDEFESQSKSWPPTEKEDIDRMRDQFNTVRGIMADGFGE